MGIGDRDKTGNGNEAWNGMRAGGWWLGGGG